MTTLFESGYRMPAEWEPHESTWLSWPKDPLTFPENIIGPVEETYVDMITALQKDEKVDLLVDDHATEDRISSMLSSKSNIRFHKIKSQDVWVRDYGPIFVKRRGEVAATKWIFNAWGRKYDELLKDNETGLEICRSLGVETFEPGIVLEGGSIDVDGFGLCLTTEQCLLNKNRNPTLNRNQIEKYLHDYLGAKKTIWLGDGISGDDTDGHVDDIARFVGPGKIACMVEEDESEENYRPLKKNCEALKEIEGLEVTTITMPGKIEDEDGNRLPASYANFYVGNGLVLVPVFGTRNDDMAISTLSGLFPDRKVIGMDCTELVFGFGGIHCVTQQMPSRATTV